MKGKKGHKAEGGSTGGEDEAKMDLDDKPEERTANDKIGKEAEEKKRGGRA